MCIRDRIGNVASHKLQALVIVNATGNASGREIFDFSSLIIDSVKEKFGIELEREAVSYTHLDVYKRQIK